MPYNRVDFAERSAASSHKLAAMHEQTIAETPERLADAEADLVRFQEMGWTFLVKVAEGRIASYKRQLAFAEEHVSFSQERAVHYDSIAAQSRADELDGAARR